ncbi:MAG TPA: CopG family transcriptional regulator [Trebonia sp.]|jgi:predicted transcriptional regulator
MVKTSVYLDDEQKQDLDRVAQLTGRSQADLIRDGISQVIHDHLAKRPKMRARFHDPSIVGRTEDLLEGLGE